MAAFAEEVAVFAETSLGTRIVMTVPLDIKASDFKRKLEKTHTSCFSSFGEIRVLGLMVKRRSRFYYVAESVPIKFIFRDNQKPWLIHAETRVVNGSQESSISNGIDKGQIRHCSASDDSIEGVIGSIQGEKKKTKKPRPKPDSRNFASRQTYLDSREFVGPSASEPETVTSSLSRADEMKNSECLNSFTPITPERKPGDSVRINEMISKKLIVAANNIRMQGKTHVSTTLSSSIFRSKSCRKRSLDGKTISSLAKFLVFKIPDTED